MLYFTSFSCFGGDSDSERLRAWGLCLMDHGVYWRNRRSQNKLKTFCSGVGCDGSEGHLTLDTGATSLGFIVTHRWSCLKHHPRTTAPSPPVTFASLVSACQAACTPADVTSPSLSRFIINTTPQTIRKCKVWVYASTCWGEQLVNYLQP